MRPMLKLHISTTALFCIYAARVRKQKAIAEQKKTASARILSTANSIQRLIAYRMMQSRKLQIKEP
jgi:hypothetical protein